MLIGNFIKDNQSAHLFLPTLEEVRKHSNSFNNYNWRQKYRIELKFGPKLYYVEILQQENLSI